MCDTCGCNVTPGNAHLAQARADGVFGQAALATQLLYGPRQAFGQVFEHE